MADKSSAITLAKQGKPNELQQPKKQENCEAQGAPAAQKITNLQSGKPEKQEEFKPRVMPTIEQITNRESRNTPRTKVYLRIKIGGQSEGRIVIELFKDTAPNTAGEFEMLCRDGVYTNSTFHEVHGYTCHAGRDIGGPQENRPLFHEGEVPMRPTGIPRSTPHDNSRILCIPRDTTGGRGREFIICRAADSTIYAAHVVAGLLTDNGYQVLRKIEYSLGSTTTAANSQYAAALPGPSTASATITATAATTATAAATTQGAAARPGPSTASPTRPTVLIEESGVELSTPNRAY